jgi:hypothetical protein
MPASLCPLSHHTAESGVFQREMAGTHVLGGHQRGSIPLPDDPAAIGDRKPVGDGGTQMLIVGAALILGGALLATIKRN